MRRPKRRGRTRGPNTIDSLIGKHRGEVVVVIGNSASLNKMDLSILDGFTTIGVNRILRIYEPTYLFVADQSVVYDEHERMKEASGRVGMIVFPGVMSSKIRKEYYSGPFISTGMMSTCSKPIAKKGPIHICRGGNSGYEAVQVAYRMGASVIAMAGIDMRWPAKGPSHFFGDGRRAGCKMAEVHWKIEDFAAMKASYRSAGVEVVSVSPWRTPFRDAMEYVPLEELQTFSRHSASRLQRRK